MDSKVTYKEWKGKKVKFKIIDTDPDKHKELIKKGIAWINLVYYDISKAIVVLYDMTNQESSNDTVLWIESIINQCNHKPFVILVGNKKDIAKPPKPLS